VRSFTSCRRWLREHVTPAASSHPGGAPEQLRDDREALEARVDGGGAQLGLGFGGAVARAARDLGVGFRGVGGGLNRGRVAPWRAGHVRKATQSGRVRSGLRVHVSHGWKWKMTRGPRVSMTAAGARASGLRAGPIGRSRLG
jgi:hypothetical protein